jgi:prepilin-type N-terminal cleavage/methylation domain-containing protein
MRGVTLVELVVAMLVMGLLSGLGALALRSLRPEPADPWSEAVARARAAAVRGGRAVSIVGDSGRTAFLLPDGRVVARGLDQLTGEALPAAR